MAKVEELGLEEKVLELSRAGHSRREIANLLSTGENRLSHMSISRFLQTTELGNEAQSASEEQLHGLELIIKILEEEIDRELDFADICRSKGKTSPVYSALFYLSSLRNERAKLLAKLKAAENSAKEVVK